MSSSAHKRYQYVQKQLEVDQEYLYLEKRFREQETLFRQVMAELSEEQRDTINEFMGICSEMDDRILEIAFFIP